MSEENSNAARRPALDALALLTASYHGATGEVIRQVLDERAESMWHPDANVTDVRLQGLNASLEKLADKIGRLTDLLGRMTELTRTLVDKVSALADVETDEILQALGRALNAPEL